MGRPAADSGGVIAACGIVAAGLFVALLGQLSKPHDNPAWFGPAMARQANDPLPRPEDRTYVVEMTKHDGTKVKVNLCYSDYLKWKERPPR